MKAINSPPDKYRKLKTHSGSRIKNSTGPDKDRNRRPVKSELSKPGKKQTGQIALVILLSMLCIGLILLIVFLIQPGKTQFWQSIPGKTSDKPAVVKRLEPTEPAQPVSETNQPEATPAAVPERPEGEKSTESAQTRETRVYFVKVNTEGLISLKSVNRSIDFNKSPLTQTINSLIGGPLSDEINKGSLTLIPEGTRLLSARVEGGTAYLNFNEAFRFNPLGREGYLAQLKQIVYTSTEFPSIKNVQILIEGVIKEYLGGEGFYIGEPLSRDSFQNNP